MTALHSFQNGQYFPLPTHFSSVGQRARRGVLITVPLTPSAVGQSCRYYETSHDEMSVLTPQQIFASVNGREPPSEPFHRIQQWVVMYCVDPDNGSAHLDELVQYLRDTVETNTLVLPHSSVNQPTAQPPLEQGRLRFFAHLVIFLRGVGLLPRRLKPVPRGAPLGPENERVAAGNLVIGK